MFCLYYLFFAIDELLSESNASGMGVAKSMVRSTPQLHSLGTSVSNGEFFFCCVYRVLVCVREIYILCVLLF